MSKNRRWIWILLSLVLAAILGVVAAGYTATIVADYRRMVQFASEFQAPRLPESPTITLTLGSIGFAAAIVGLMVFLFRLLREMKVNQVQSEFIARVSHELKTPLATIELTADLLRTQENDAAAASIDAEERQKLWRSHDEELDRLKRQVNSLLETARWQVSPPRVRSSRIRLGEWIESQKPRWLEILGRDSTIELDVGELDFEVDADLEKFELIFSNLVDNARKFARPDASGPTLRVRGMIPYEDRWAIEVEDSGWGFPKELSKRLFQRFYRAPNGAPYAIAGTGLGLHLSLAAAQAMKLKLSARSEGVGRGAIFRIEGRR